MRRRSLDHCALRPGRSGSILFAAWLAGGWGSARRAGEERPPAEIGSLRVWCTAPRGSWRMHRRSRTRRSQPATFTPPRFSPRAVSPESPRAYCRSHRPVTAAGSVRGSPQRLSAGEGPAPERSDGARPSPRGQAAKGRPPFRPASRPYHVLAQKASGTRFARGVIVVTGLETCDASNSSVPICRY